MTDYYPLISRWLADYRNILARHELYWLARSELEIQLCSFEPPLSRSDMMNERLALNEAIRRVERDCSPPVASIPELFDLSLREAQGLQPASKIHMYPEGRRGTRQRQAADPLPLQPRSTLFGPLIRYSSLALAIGLGSALYHQRDRVFALLAGSPVTAPHSVKVSLPTLDYYVGKLGELGKELRHGK